MRSKSENEIVKKIAIDFFYWWHNQPGANTEQGFDDYCKTERYKMLCTSITTELDTTEQPEAQQQKEIERLKDEVQQLVKKGLHYKGNFEHAGNRIAELEAQLKEKNAALKIAVKYARVRGYKASKNELDLIQKALESSPKEQPEATVDLDQSPPYHMCLWENWKKPTQEQPEAQNYICLHCKKIFSYEPIVCNECRGKTFHKTEAQQNQPEAQQQFEMKFGRHLMCILTITSNNIVVNSALNGWGDVIPVDEISITRK